MKINTIKFCATDIFLQLLLPFLSALFLIRPLDSMAEGRALRVGVISGLTGMAGKWNHFQNMGIELAAEDLIKEGWDIKIIVEDSQTVGAKVISSLEKLVTFDKVDAIIADDFGFAITPAAARVAQYKKPFVALSLPQEHYCAEFGHYLFSITSQFSQSVNAFERFYALHPEVKSIALITFDDPEWGSTYLRIWENLARQHGVKIVDSVISNDFAVDFKNIFTRIMPKKPDAIFIAHEPEAFHKAKKQFEYGGYVVTANNALEMLSETPKRTELEGVYIVDPVISADFKNKFISRYGRAPILEAYAGYEAMMALVKAFEADPANPQAGMRKVKYQGIAGPIDFTVSGCAGNFAKWGLFRFENGQMVEQ